MRSYPFKPNFYETAGEHKLLIVDAIRIFMTLSIVTAILITKIVYQVRNKILMDRTLFANYCITGFIFVAYIVQAALTLLLQGETVSLVKSEGYINSYRIA